MYDYTVVFLKAALAVNFGFFLIFNTRVQEK